MEAVLPIAMRWLHLASVIVLLGGVFYARAFAGDLDPRFKPLAYVAIGAILGSGLYNFLSKMSPSRDYQVWFGIKVLLALHIFASLILYRQKKLRSLTGVIISGAIIVAISGYLRWMSLPR